MRGRGTLGCSQRVELYGWEDSQRWGTREEGVGGGEALTWTRSEEH